MRGIVEFNVKHVIDESEFISGVITGVILSNFNETLGKWTCKTEGDIWYIDFPLDSKETFFTCQELIEKMYPDLCVYSIVCF